MARTDRKQRPASPGVDLAGKRPASAGAVLTLTASALAALWAIALLTEPGRIGYRYTFYFVEFFGGVFTLVGLTLTVMIGVLATDRLVLQPRQRVWIQSAHRTLGIFSVAWLAFHILTKVSEGRASLLGTILPFLGGTVDGQSVLYVGLGPIAGYLMASVLWTGLVRRRFAGVGRPWMWRTLHSVAYLSWPVALLHGLGAGRPPATWVTLSYLACVLLVAVALLFRLSRGTGRRVQRDRLATTTMSTGAVSIRPIGKIASSPARRELTSGREAPARDEAPRREVTGRELTARREPVAYDDTRFLAEILPPTEKTAPAGRTRRAGREETEPVPRSRRTTVERERIIDSTWRGSEPDDERADQVRATAESGRRRRADAVPPAEERTWRRADDDGARAGRRRAIQDRPASAAPTWREDERDERDERPTTAPAPPRRRRVSADDYLVTDVPGRGADPYDAASVYGPPPARRRADRQPDEGTRTRAGAPRGTRYAEDGEDTGRAPGRRTRYRDEDRPRDEERRYRDEDRPRDEERRYRDEDRPRDEERRYRDDEPPARSEPRRAARYADEDRPRRAGRYADEEPRYRATAPAPPYIPAPSAMDDLVPELDVLPPDETPTLVDLASRRAIRDATRERDAAREREGARETATRARRARRRGTADKDDPDEEYWGYLRGEAQ